MNTEPHAETAACQGLHCAIHDVDEASGERACFECGHSWPTRADLVKDHNDMVKEMNAQFPHIPLPEEADPERIWSCPFCAHDL